MLYLDRLRSILFEKTLVRILQLVNRGLERGCVYLSMSAFVWTVFFLSPGVGIYDWKKEVAYFSYIKTSLFEYHSLPWYWWAKSAPVARFPAVAHTGAFICNPETMLFSVWTPLLAFFSVPMFIKLLGLVHFMIGTLGALALKKRLQWNDFQFRLYSGLFLLSPIVIQHVSVGYTPWLNLFFFPWLIYFLFAPRRLSRILGTSVVLALCLLQGGSHVFLWFLLVTVLVLAFSALYEKCWTHILEALTIITLSAVLSFARIYSTAIAYSDFVQDFQPGYNPLNFLFWALIPPIMIPPLKTPFLEEIVLGVPAWDGAVFWGAGFFLLLILVVNYRRYRNATRISQLSRYDSLFSAALVLLVLSFFSFFETCISSLNAIVELPFSQGAEKYPFRFAITSYLAFAVVIAAFSKEVFSSATNFLRGVRTFKIRETTLQRLIKVTFILLIGLGTALLCFGLGWYPIEKYLEGALQAAYSGTGYHWLGDYLSGRHTHSFDTYLGQLRRMYVGGLSWLGAGIIILGLSHLLLRKLIVEKSPFLAIEGVIVIPLFFASMMWLGVATSTGPERYMLQDTISPRIRLEPTGAAAMLETTPSALTVIPLGQGAITQCAFPDLPQRDRKMLNSSHKGLRFEEGEAFMKLRFVGSVRDKSFSLKFRTEDFSVAFLVTGVVWVVVGCLGMANLLLIRKSERAA